MSAVLQLHAFSRQHIILAEDIVVCNVFEKALNINFIHVSKMSAKTIANITESVLYKEIAEC